VADKCFLERLGKMYKNFNKIYPNDFQFNHSDQTAIILPESKEHISYNTLIDRATAASNILKEKGITRKNRVLVKWDSNYIPELMGMINVCSVTIIGDVSTFELQYLIERGKFSAELYDWKNLNKIENNGIEGCDENEGLGIISSGTSGRDRTIVSVPRTRFHYWAFNSMKMFGADTRSLVVVSPVFSAGSSHLISTLLNGGTAIIACGFLYHSSDNLKNAMDYRPNHIHGAPTTYRLLMDLMGDSYNYTLKHCRITGSKSDINLLNRIFDEIKPDSINSVYGTNENGPAFINIMKSKNDIDESIGIPDEGYEYKIDESKQMWIRGGSGGEEFYNTEDLAEEKDGKIYLIGRSGDVIIKNSYSIIPNEVENILEKCDNVTEVVVFGKQTESTSSKICCVYTVDKNYIKGSIEIHAKNSLSKYKIPEEWNMVDVIPKTKNDKISRAKLSKLF